MSRRYFPFVLVSFACLACAKDPEPIDYSRAAYFTYSGALQPRVPIQFTGTSPNVLGYSWSFGDGTPSGTGQSPVHTFTKAGTFFVRLTVSLADGATTSTTQQLAIVQPDTLGPYFAAIAGEYRLTKKYYYSWPGNNPGPSTTACDILVTPERSGDYLTITQNGAPFQAGLQLGRTPYTADYYTFFSPGSHYSYNQATFKPSADSIVITSVLNGGPGGGTTQSKWWGKRR